MCTLGEKIDPLTRGRPSLEETLDLVSPQTRVF